MTVDDINMNLESSLRKIHNFIQEKPIHISFDVDSLDPYFFESTGTPVPDGLNLESTKKVEDSLLSENIINMDITEINLDLGKRYRNLPNLKYLFGKYIRNSKL